jgi:hypothetical protein
MNFDFKNPNENPLVLEITPTLFLHLERVANSYAILSFHNEENQKIDLPEDLIVYDHVYDDLHGILQPKTPHDGIYTLSWTENYVVQYKGQIILKMSNPRLWEIRKYT